MRRCVISFITSVMLSSGEQTTTTFVISSETAIPGSSASMRRQAIGKIALGNDAVDGPAVIAHDHGADLLGTQLF